MKNALRLLLTVFVVVVVVAGVSFFYIKTTPQYALYELGQGFAEHDLAKVEQHLDIGAVSGQLGDAVGRYMQKEADKPSTATNEWEAAGEAWGKSLVQAMIPGLVTKAKDAFSQGIKDAISGKETEVGKDVSYKSLTWKDLLPKGRISVTRSSKDRLVTVTLEDKKFVFKMSKTDGKWKIVSWENVDEQLNSVATIGDDNKTDDSKTVKNAKFGELVDISSGWYVTIAEPQVYVPANEFSRAEKGKKYMSVDVLYENTGKESGSYDPSNFELQDSESHRYKREYTGKEPMLESGNLLGGEKVRGHLTYEVPEDVSNISVRYSSYAGGTLLFEK